MLDRRRTMHLLTASSAAIAYTRRAAQSEYIIIQKYTAAFRTPPDRRRDRWTADVSDGTAGYWDAYTLGDQFLRRMAVLT